MSLDSTRERSGSPALPHEDNLAAARTLGTLEARAGEAAGRSKALPPLELADILISTQVVSEAPAEPTHTPEVLELQKNNRVLQNDELKRCHYLQATLQNMLTLFGRSEHARLPGETTEGYDARVKPLLESTRRQVALEVEAGVFGPATRKAYQQYIQWLQEKAVPEAVREMDSFRLPIPPGCPSTIPGDRLQRSISPDLFRAMSSANELKTSLALDANALPGEAALCKLDACVQWLEECNSKMTLARAEHDERRLNALIREGLPYTWLRRPGEDLLAWRASAAELVDLSARSRNYIEALQSLYKLDKRGDMQVSLPPGTVLKVQHNDRVCEITAQDLTDKNKLHQFGNGQILEIKLDLPTDLRQENPVNARKIDQLRTWLANNADEIDKNVRQLVRIDQNPDSVIMYGDQEVRNGKGIFNAQGEFIAIARPNYRPQPGEQLKDVNLLGYDFEVVPIPDKPGRFQVIQTITAEHAPWFAYQNFRALGVDKLGVKRLPPVELGADDFIPIRNGDKIELLKVGKLKAFRDWEQFAYYGEKGLVGTMDAAMLATGTIEIGAAVRGARIAATGANAALRLEGGEAAWQLSKGILRVSVGGAGILNGAGGRDIKVGDLKVGEGINHARGLYFLGDVSLGLARGGWSFIRAAKAGENPLTGAQKVHGIIHGVKVGDKVLEGTPFIRHAHTLGSYAFKATEYAFAPVIASELTHQVRKIADQGKRDSTKDAITLIGDGRGMQAVKKGDFSSDNRKSREGTVAILDEYARSLGEGREQATKDEISALFNETKQALAGDDATRRALANRLVERITFNADEIREMEKAHPANSSQGNFRLTAEQIRQLADPDKRRDFPASVRTLAERYMGSKNADVAAATSIALLFLGRDADGVLNNSLGTMEVTVPEYNLTVLHNHGEHSYTQTIKVDARTFSVNVTATEAVTLLKQQLAGTEGVEKKIAVGDTLTRIGAITHRQYAGLLQDVLLSGATAREKLKAMSDPFGARLVTIADGLRHEELGGSLGGNPESSAVERDRKRGESFGLTYTDLVKTLEVVAKTDASADVRAMAAAQLYALNETNAHRRVELLAAFNTMLQECQAKAAGHLAERINHFLTNEMNTTLAGDTASVDFLKERKLNAAIALSYITEAGDKGKQASINGVIASCFSTTNPILAQRTIDAILPDRIKQLTLDNPSIAREFQAAVVSSIKLPESFEAEKNVLSLLEKLEPLLQGADVRQKQSAKLQLEMLLTRESASYAEYFPRLRAAAITTLTKLGSQGSLDLIRSHACLSQKLKLGTRELDAAESDPRVRLAAIESLQKLKDVELRSYIGQLIDKENDITVATALRDVNFSEQRIERDSRRYKEEYEKYLTLLTDPFNEKKYPTLASFNEGAATNFINEKFPLLNKDTFQSRAKSAVDSANDWLDRRFTTDARLELLEYRKAEEIFKENGQQWRELEELALGEGVEADKARKALYYIAWSVDVNKNLEREGPMRIQSENRDSVYHRHYCIDARHRAVQILLKCCEPGCKGRDFVAAVVTDLLTTKIGGAASDMMATDLLKAAKRLHETGALDKQTVGIAYAKALENELGRPVSDQREWLQSELVEALKNLKYRAMFPAFEAIAEKSAFPQVKQKGQQALAELRDSVPAMWNETVTDQASNAAARAERVASKVGGKADADDLIQTVFNAYKGYKFQDTNDPGLAHLGLAMRDSNERVRLAAALVVAESELPLNNRYKLEAIAALAQLTKCSTPAQQVAALEALQKLPLQKQLIIALPGGTLLLVDKEGPELRFTELPPVVQRPVTEAKMQELTVTRLQQSKDNPAVYVPVSEKRRQTVYTTKNMPFQPKTTWGVRAGKLTHPQTIFEGVSSNQN